MRRTRKLDPGEAKAMAKEEQRRMEELDSQGLCYECGDSPRNPYLTEDICLDCWESNRPYGCMKKGCVQASAGSFRQGQYCKVHLAHTIHKAYEDYLEQKSKLEEEKRRYYILKSLADFDPENESKPPRELEEIDKSVSDKRIELVMMKQEVNWLKQDIKDAIKQLDEPFPENYSVPV